ncbi:MAG: XisI protein [Limnoraphis robusta]|uniref:DNA element excision controlling factor XisI n=1 Tax=Limnoraphis robusta CS-951 TaxID=1637645 RepID=A0A0F5YHN2_9CYAN|nr:XisI protein [Limnoraphis robusta]KKD38419.1 DNA element excision controlling factor XisI [Limnoraphis robusta CS-951]MEA5543089.1 XisI protein [Limnoraphis robusta Tam1]
MDKLERYRTFIKRILTEYHDWVSDSSNLTDESCLVFDDQHNHYIWLFLGWEGKKQTRHIQVHIRIKNEKIYIEQDWTEEGIVTELLNLGVPKEDIVLAFYPPEERKFTEFATM